MKRAIYKSLALISGSALLATGTSLYAANGFLKEKAAPLAVTLPASAYGEGAISALGKNLPAVASAHGMTAQRLQQLFREDHLLKVDRTGRLFYEEPALGYGALASGESSLAEAAPTTDQALLLHSRPGAKRILYLDFDGHLLSGSAWNASNNGGNDIVCPPWDIDGNPAVFGETERARIIQIWQRVAEDFAPFDVDVTTEFTGENAINRSSSADEFYGMRVLISPISSYFGNYGGFAYIGAFNDVGDYYKPALVFPEKLSNGEKYIAEACSHEAGHTLGLNHDGKTDGTSYYSGHGAGDTGWSPIMGVGYYKNLSQWSKGEYALANNTQDDLAIIQTYVAYRADDHGNHSSSATILAAGGSIVAAGIIETTNDQDLFRFVTGAGMISFSIDPFERGPNLDLVAELYDSGGNLVGSSNPLDYLNASFSQSVGAGTYFLLIRGTGNADPLTTGYTRYGSLGQYVIAGTVVDPSGSVHPVANASSSTTSGDAPLSVQFNGSQSYDPDGTLASYFWSFGDGAVSQEINPSHTYTTIGNYTATLTVSDNQGLTGSDSITINVLAANALPSASISASPLSGVAPLTVSFNGSSSSDPDGSIVAYQWNFGDGTTGTGATVQHLYPQPGSYTARLTVTDNRGATASSTVIVQVSQNPAQIMRVQAIALSVVTVKRTTTIEARVTVTDLNGTVVSGATVSGQFGGVVTGSTSGTTSSTGVALIKSKALRKGGTVSFTVSGVSKATFVYDPTKNLVTSSSIAAGQKF